MGAEGDMKKSPTRKPVVDRVAIPGGAACPRCAATMIRYKRPAGFVPNGSPFSCVTLWDKCDGDGSCGWIARLEEAAQLNRAPTRNHRAERSAVR
jgi:hypothetical protein